MSVSPDDCTRCHYIPHHAVRKDSPTTLICIVNDCSCHQSRVQPSLNDCLLSGDPQLNDLGCIICNSDAILLEFALTLRKCSSISGYIRMTEIGPNFCGWPITQKVSSKMRDLLFGAVCTFHEECHSTLPSALVQIQYSTTHAYQPVCG